MRKQVGKYRLAAIAFVAAVPISTSVLAAVTKGNIPGFYGWILSLATLFFMLLVGSYFRRNVVKCVISMFLALAIYPMIIGIFAMPFTID
jgi:ABC-type multidrug transport system permease subunit